MRYGDVHPENNLVDPSSLSVCAMIVFSIPVRNVFCDISEISKCFRLRKGLADGKNKCEGKEGCLRVRTL